MGNWYLRTLRCADGGDSQKVINKYGAKFPVAREDLIAWIRQSAEQLMALFGGKTEKKRWAEKTPAHVYHIELIKETFPGAQIVHMIRSAYDVVRSLQRMPWAPKKIRYNVKIWSNSIIAGKLSGAKLSPHDYIEVRYEELITNPAAVLQATLRIFERGIYTTTTRISQSREQFMGETLQPLQGNPVNKHPNLGFFERLAYYWQTNKLKRHCAFMICYKT